MDEHLGVFAYEGRAAQAVQRLKYERATALAEPMADLLREEFHHLRIEADMVIPVPIHWIRRFQRGFNQAELLAQGLPDSLYQPNALRRVRPTRPQVGLSPERRKTNLVGAFRASTAVSGKRILLVDDVVTTGSTLIECAKCLRLAGASSVSALTFTMSRG